MPAKPHKIQPRAPENSPFLPAESFSKVHERYLGFNQVLQNQFGEKVFRVSINTGLSCPNIDGTRAKGGCYFCNDDYLLARSFEKQRTLEDQMIEGMDYLKQRHKSTSKFLAYFQNGTNTHGPANMIRPWFENSLLYKNVVGLLISTRPDCLGEEILDLLEELNQKTYLWVELGLQSAQNHVLEKINRAHSVEEFDEACFKLAKRGIKVCAHMIIGMPGESEEEILSGADHLNQLPVAGIKLHNLFVVKHTVLAKWHAEKKYTPLSLENYAKLCVDYLELLRPDMVIHRLNAHGPRPLTIAPEWSINKLQTMNAVHDELEKRNSWQGKKYQAS